VIICDTREKKNLHVLQYFDQHGIEYAIRKLDTGDYMSTSRDRLTIDRKQDLSEICGNLCSPDKSRFWREVRRAKAERVKMIVLIEQGGAFKTLKDVPQWRGKYTKVTGYQLYNEMCRCSIAYGVEFLFCDKRSTGRRIAELLGENNKGVSDG